jgi:hypothetical protein
MPAFAIKFHLITLSTSRPGADLVLNERLYLSTSGEPVKSTDITIIFCTDSLFLKCTVYVVEVLVFHILVFSAISARDFHRSYQLWPRRECTQARVVFLRLSRSPICPIDFHKVLLSRCFTIYPLEAF